jgi:hypothetical protein
LPSSPACCARLKKIGSRWRKLPPGKIALIAELQQTSRATGVPIELPTVAPL